MIQSLCYQRRQERRNVLRAHTKVVYTHCISGVSIVLSGQVLLLLLFGVGLGLYTRTHSKAWEQPKRVGVGVWIFGVRLYILLNITSRTRDKSHEGL